MQTTHHNQRITAKQVAKHLRMTRASSIGDTERLANVFSDQERHALWFAHSDTFKGPTQIMIDTVMADCHRRIASMCNAGNLSLWPQQGSAA